MDEGVVREPEDDVTHIVGLVRGQLLEDGLDASLVFIRGYRRLCRVARHQPLVHAVVIPGSDLLDSTPYGRHRAEDTGTASGGLTPRVPNSQVCLRSCCQRLVSLARVLPDYDETDRRPHG